MSSIMPFLYRRYPFVWKEVLSFQNNHEKIVNFQLFWLLNIKIRKFAFFDVIHV